jgi:DNA-binding transcriptional ArsR family regulator
VNHIVQCSSELDEAFAALSDGTRRGILERLGRQDASISELAWRARYRRSVEERLGRLGEFLEKTKGEPW